VKQRLLIVTTVPISLALLLEGQPRWLARTYEVELVTGEGPELDRVRAQEGLPVHVVPFTRSITPRGDLGTLTALTRLMGRFKPHLVQTYTPKAGLLGMTAARLARVPVRVHGIVGMPLMEAQGAKRMLLGATERVTYTNATHLTANSHGLRDWVWAHLSSRPIRVIGHGSINGVDTERFAPASAEDRAGWRKVHRIPDDAFVFVYVGRLVKDKGVAELLHAFTRVHDTVPNAVLVVVGTRDDTDPLIAADDAELHAHKAIRAIGFQTDVRPALGAADVFVLPSYREGMPNSLLEAGAMGLPSVTTNIPGCAEVVIDGENGLLVPAKDEDALTGAMRRLATDPELYRRLRAASRPSIDRRYDQQVFWRALDTFYSEIAAGLGG
jgi:glycosyltransferase involved in cell wall biosynthesis